jgi:hypothetical protein
MWAVLEQLPVADGLCKDGYIYLGGMYVLEQLLLPERLPVAGWVVPEQLPVADGLCQDSYIYLGGMY